MKVPLCIPEISEEEITAVSEVLRSGWLAHGPYNHKMEELFCEKLGVSNAITMNSCTSALEVALKVNGIKGEVIVPSFTWVASANCVLMSGAVPVLCEVDRKTRNVTVDLVREKITSKTEAVIAVHYGGQPADMTGLKKLCDDKGLLFIEDSAETLGATWKGHQAGSLGIGCFSFFPTKNITTGEGGMFTCNDDATTAKARALIAHGVPSTTHDREKKGNIWERAAIMPGHNFRLSNVLACIGYVQMQKLDEMNRRRMEVAKQYDRLLASVPGVETPFVEASATHVYQMYTILVPAKIRNKLVYALREKEIGASVHFDPPVHKQPFYLDYFKGLELPVTERLSSELITLPIFPGMTSEQTEFVAASIFEFMEENC